MIKLRNILTEKKELGGALINKIERLTDRNSHNMSRRVLAMAMGNKKLASVYGSMEEINVALGHLPPELSKLRNKLDKKLFNGAKRVYSDYDAISGAF